MNTHYQDGMRIASNNEDASTKLLHDKLALLVTRTENLLLHIDGMRNHELLFRRSVIESIIDTPVVAGWLDGMRKAERVDLELPVRKVKT